MNRLEEHTDVQSCQRGKKERKGTELGNCFCHLCAARSSKESLPQSRDSDTLGQSLPGPPGAQPLVVQCLLDPLAASPTLSV